MKIKIKMLHDQYRRKTNLPNQLIYNYTINRVSAEEYIFT